MGTACMQDYVLFPFSQIVQLERDDTPMAVHWSVHPNPRYHFKSMDNEFATNGSLAHRLDAYNRKLSISITLGFQRT